MSTPRRNSEKSSLAIRRSGNFLVSFTERAGAIRIISARRATKRERKDYEETPRR